MKLFLGTHTHRHGTTSYLFESTTETGLGTSDFIRHLGDEYESDRDDEFLDFEPITPERINA